LSNVTANPPGSTVVGVTGTVSGASSWILDYCCPPPNNTYTTISTGTGTLVSGNWETLWVPSGLLFPYLVPNGTYTLRLRALDAGGNTLATATVTPVIANFSVRQSGKHYGLQLNWTVPDTVTYTSILPDLGNLTPSETLFIKNSTGTTVRTFPANTPKGTYTNDWKGRTDSDGLLPDGNYFYIATVTAGSYSMTWDVSGRFLYTNDTYTANNPVTISDSFNNLPFRFSYNLYQGQGSDLDLPSQVWLIFGKTAPAQGNCGPEQYCVFAGVFQPGGNRTVEWAYVDGYGRYRGAPSDTLPALRHFILYARVTNFPLNMVILYGGGPKVAGVKVTPAVFRFGASGQTVEFDLAMPTGDRANPVTVSFQNQASGSILRTLTLSNQAPGHITTSWDGRVDNNGPPVAPGFYTVTVTATGPRADVAIGQILTTVQY